MTFCDPMLASKSILKKSPSLQVEPLILQPFTDSPIASLLVHCQIITTLVFTSIIKMPVTQYMTFFWLSKILPLCICFMIDITCSSQDGIVMNRLQYLQEGEQLAGKVISTSRARSRMQCNIR